MSHPTQHAEAIKLIRDRRAVNAQNLKMYDGKPEPYSGYRNDLEAHDTSLRMTLRFLEADNAEPAKEEPHAD